MTDTSLAGQLLHLIHPISTICFCPSSSSSACLSGHCHQPVPILTASVPENAGISILFRFRHLGPAMPLPHPCLQHLWVLPLSLQPLPSDLCFQIHGWSPPQEVGRLRRCRNRNAAYLIFQSTLDKSVLLELLIICMTLWWYCLKHAQAKRMIRASNKFHYVAVPRGKFLRKNVSGKDPFSGSSPYAAG